MIILFLQRLFEGLRRRHERRATIKALSALSDHHLKDIGIERDDIVSLANSLEREGHASAGHLQARRIDDGERPGKRRRTGVTPSGTTSQRCALATTYRFPVKNQGGPQ